jgi:CelD/BcsL family acetyltransferase involved in cellulose biosynthesis
MAGRMSSMGRIAVATDREGVSPPRLETVSPPSAALRPAAEALAALADEWRALAALAAEPNCFAEHWFVAASLPTMGEGRDIRIAEVRRAGRLIGVLSLAVEPRYGRLAVAHVENWCHHHMFLGTPLVAAGEEEAFWRALLDALDRSGWAPNFLHLRALVEDGPVHRGLLAARNGARVHREVRAFLASDLGPQAYYEQAVRQKKRKELRRLRNRLAELGPVETHILADGAALDDWAERYLAMEAAGWKGRAGTALAGNQRTARFFKEALAAAWAEKRLQFLRLDLAGRPIAMLVNFLSAPGSFSFKTVFDEDHARFSPGVLIQIENLAILDDPAIRWMDSCAAEDHPMIDSLWMERRALVRITVRLKGAHRFPVFAASRALEEGWRVLKRLRGRR